MGDVLPESETRRDTAASPSFNTIPRRGKIIMAEGQLLALNTRWWPSGATSAQIWLDTKCRPVKQDHCLLRYTSTRSSPGYLTLDYLRSGSRTSLQTFRGSLLVLDEIARLRRAIAIFAHVGTSAISDRLMLRWGWQPHATKISGRHWIKRFYDGYAIQDLTHLGPQAVQLSSNRGPSDSFH